MEIANDIFKRKAYDPDKLLEYGFTYACGIYAYSTLMSDGRFSLEVRISDKEITTDVIEISTAEPFALYHIDAASGAFVGKLRAASEEVLLDIAEKCFHTQIFKSAQAKMLIEYAFKKYGNSAEYLWEKFPDNAIFRRSDNNKWYAALLTVERKKLGLDGVGTIEIVDQREEPELLDSLIDGKKYFYGYHMNKKHWYTVCLDNSVSDEELKRRIDRSYDITH